MYMIHRDATETQITGHTLFEGLTDVDYDCLCVRTLPFGAVESVEPK